MRRPIVLLLALAFALPASAEGQFRLLVGGGVTSPLGDLSDLAGTGYHAMVGLHLTISSWPVSIRGDGMLHRLGASEAEFDTSQVIGGALSAVYTLPGISFRPYLLGGIGSYRTETGLVGETETFTDTGYHGGFGVELGSGAIQAFAEIRYAHVPTDRGTYRLVPVTIGLRL